MTYQKLRQEEIKLTQMMQDVRNRRNRTLRKRLNEVKSLVALKAQAMQRQRYK